MQQHNWPAYKSPDRQPFIQPLIRIESAADVVTAFLLSRHFRTKVEIVEGVVIGRYLNDGWSNGTVIGIATEKTVERIAEINRQLGVIADNSGWPLDTQP